MEKILNKQIDEYIVQFKKDIHSKILDIGFNEKEKANCLMEFVYDYNKLEFNREDVMKRKRNKNTVPDSNRCSALLINNEQCTRRKKNDCEFCGTHMKGTPNGVLKLNSQQKMFRVEVVAKEINGIVYYIDDKNRVYNTEEIMSGRENPSVIGYVASENNHVVYV